MVRMNKGSMRNSGVSHEGTVSTRRMVHYPLSEGRSTGSFYTHMLVEDIATGIIPSSLRSENEGFEVALNTPSRKAEDLLCAGLRSLRLGARRSLRDAVYWFVNDVAYLIAWYGAAFYEVVYHSARTAPQNVTGFTLDVVPNHSVFYVFGSYWQFVPKGVRDRYLLNARTLTRLRPDELLVLPMPKQLGGPRRHRRILSGLSAMGAGTPEFHLREMSDPSKRMTFDLKVFTRIQERRVARLTRDMGWHARWFLRNERPVTDFCLAHRRLRFEKSRAILRQAIVEGLNDALRRVGKQLGIDLQFQLRGVASPAD